MKYDRGVPHNININIAQKVRIELTDGGWIEGYISKLSFMHNGGIADVTVITSAEDIGPRLVD